MIGLSNKTILKYVNQGKLTPIRMNKRVFRFKYSDVINFLEEHTNVPLAHS